MNVQCKACSIEIRRSTEKKIPIFWLIISRLLTEKKIFAFLADHKQVINGKKRFAFLADHKQQVINRKKDIHFWLIINRSTEKKGYSN